MNPINASKSLDSKRYEAGYTTACLLSTLRYHFFCGHNLLIYTKYFQLVIRRNNSFLVKDDLVVVAARNHYYIDTVGRQYSSYILRLEFYFHSQK
jgi:hypothetical protein